MGAVVTGMPLLGKVSARNVREAISTRFEALTREWEAEHGLLRANSKEVVLWEPLAVQDGGTKLTCPRTGRAVSPQQMAAESEADELFYGGAPGGGKTMLAIGMALTRHVNSVIFRRHYGEFEGEDHIVARIDEILQRAGYLQDRDYYRNQTKLKWARIGASRRALQLAAVQHEKDLLKWKRPHDLKVFDELPEFPERFYRFLVGWLRSTRPGQRVRVISTGNPPMTEEGMWVVPYWGPWLDPNHPNPAKPGELRWFAVVDGKDVERPNGEPFMVREADGKMRKVTPLSRTFVPAAIEDNPHYDEAYRTRLDNLPEPLRSKLRHGSFAVGVSDHEMQVIPGEWVEAAMRRWAPDGGKGQPFIRAGHDPSRGGEDEAVLAQLHGVWVAPLTIWPAKQFQDGIVGAGLVFKALGGNQVVPVQVDIVGYGASVFDQARQLGLNVVPVDGAAKSEHPRDPAKGELKFANVRAELHWRLRELLDPASKVQLALPPDPRMKADLCAPRWYPTPSGIRIEEKDEIKKRIGRSPDRGEAVMYACVGLAVAQKVARPRPGLVW